jgi:hypothetical protein
MLLGRPWLRDVKMSHNWGNNIITIQGTNTIRTIHVTKKVGAPTNYPKVLVCYDFHSRIFDICHRTRIVFNRNHTCPYISLVRLTY